MAFPANSKSLIDAGAGYIPGPAVTEPIGPETDWFKINPESTSEYQAIADRDMHFRFTALDGGLPLFTANFGYEFVIVERINGVDKKIKSIKLPLNPQNISINVPVASSTQVTMKGIVEDHNGAPLRMISISGTSGVINSELTNNTAASKSPAAATLDYAFRNTIQAATRVTSQVRKLQSAIEGKGNNAAKELNYSNDNKEEEALSLNTGFAFIHRLTRFLDYYLAMKKSKAGKHYRLMFYMHKDRQYYACMLNNYSTTKEQATIETKYTINLTAWRRDGVIKTAIQDTFSARPDAGLNNYISRTLGGIRQARKTLAKTADVLVGIRSDINDSLIAPLSETILFMKDFVGLAQTMADFMSLNFLQAAWKQNVSASNTALQRTLSSVGSASTSYGGNQNAGTTPEAIKTSIADFEYSGSNASTVEQGDTADPVSNLFKDSFKNTEVFDAVTIDELELSSEAQEVIDNKLSTVRAFTVEDLRERRDKMANFANSVSEAFGGGNATYNRVFGLQDPKQNYKKLSVNDLTIMTALNDILVAMDGQIARLENVSADSGETYYSYYADYATTAVLKFTTNQSKFFVPFPYGATLESLAVQYLQDVDRWQEIVALNGLKSPYVDESGYYIPVTASSGGNTLTVGKSDNLYVGQIVKIQSDFASIITRKIRSIDIVSATQTLITFESTTDGVSLSEYKPSENATIHAYLPNTVNSNMLIAIPSAAASPITTSFKTTPGIEDLNGLARLAKIDLLLDTQGDIIISSGGDIRVASGLTNLVQGAMLKLRTRSQSMLQIPNFGAGIDPGTSTAEVDARTILNQITDSFGQDGRYGPIISSEIRKTGPALSVSILVSIPNTNINLPISVQLPTGT